MLPLCVSDRPILVGEWEQFDLKSANVAVYLTEFVWRMGVPDVVFHDSWHGRRLAHFQGVILRSSWERIKHSFHERMREQQSAFRHLLPGGRTSPVFLFDEEPRFLV